MVDLTGYGYVRADQDGFDSSDPSSVVSPEEHKSEEFLEAVKITFDAKVIEEHD